MQTEKKTTENPEVKSLFTLSLEYTFVNEAVMAFPVSVNNIVSLQKIDWRSVFLFMTVLKLSENTCSLCRILK